MNLRAGWGLKYLLLLLPGKLETLMTYTTPHLSYISYVNL